MTRATPIPDLSRALVRARSRGRCERCGSPTATGEWHHRRSRSVRDVHTHCACNGLYLCGTCHREVHDSPMTSRLGGFIVSRHATRPGDQPVSTPWGVRLHNCAGLVTTSEEQP